MSNFKFFGSRIRINWMFWVLFAVIVFNLFQDGGMEEIHLIAIWVPALLLAVFGHELAHSMTRKKMGEDSAGMTFDGVGGISPRLSTPALKPNLRYFLSGPIFNLVIAGIAFGVLSSPWVTDPKAAKMVEGLSSSQLLTGSIVYIIYQANLFIGGINMLPILPLDMGRIFEAAMAKKSTKVVFITGLIFSLLLAAFGVVSGRTVMAFIFVVMAVFNIKMLVSKTA